MSNVKRIPVQTFNFADFCVAVAAYAQQGYSVVKSDLISEAPQHVGRVYSCWMEVKSESVKEEPVVEEEPEEAIESAEELVVEAEAGKEEVDYESMTKREIEAHVKEHLGVDLDRRLSKSKMIEQIKAM